MRTYGIIWKGNTLRSFAYLAISERPQEEFIIPKLKFLGEYIRGGGGSTHWSLQKRGTLRLRRYGKQHYLRAIDGWAVNRLLLSQLSSDSQIELKVFRPDAPRKISYTAEEEKRWLERVFTTTVGKVRTYGTRFQYRGWDEQIALSEKAWEKLSEDSTEPDAGNAEGAAGVTERVSFHAEVGDLFGQEGQRGDMVGNA